jgi:hypothetical protein
MDDKQNPYSPPVESSDAYDASQAPVERGGLSISGQGWDIVTGMSKWMKIVSTLQYVGGALLAVVLLVLVVAGGSFLRRAGSSGAMAGVVGGGVALFAYAILLFLGATWLRGAAVNFYDGVLSDAEQPLAQGFRKLRLYMILYGIFGILGLLGNVAELIFGAKWMG